MKTTTKNTDTVLNAELLAMENVNLKVSKTEERIKKCEIALIKGYKYDKTSGEIIGQKGKVIKSKINGNTVISFMDRGCKKYLYATTFIEYILKYEKSINFNSITYSEVPPKFNNITYSAVPTYKGLPTVHLKRGNSNREPNDFYPTPPYVTEELLKRENFSGTIWESACGEGAISEVLLKNGYEVHSTDLIDRGYGTQSDFLKSNSKIADNIVTNPPYKYALEFILQAKKSSNRKIAMLLPITFLESQKRYNMFMDTQYPLKTVYQFSRRVSLYKGGVKMKNSGTTAYAWYVWDKEYVGKPTIEWIL